MYAKRIAALTARMDEAGLPALLIGQPTNVLYLSGFGGSLGWLLFAGTRRFILTDFRYHERVSREADPSFELVDISGRPLFTEALPELLSLLGLTRLGYEAEHLSYLQYSQLREALPAAEPCLSWVESLREIKEPGEVEKLRAATLLGERIYSAVLPLIRPGVSENDIAAEIEYRARKAGASGMSFPPIIASGVNSALPHHATGSSQIAPARPLTIDMGVVLDNYCSDMTRTIFPGECPDKWRNVYSIVREAKDLAFAALRPGIPARDVDKVARDFIAAKGFGENFRHGLGHGVGLPFKGGPILHWASNDVLAAGQVASNEPGIYIAGEGGVRIEDLFVLHEHGPEYLNTLDTELTVLPW